LLLDHDAAERLEEPDGALDVEIDDAIDILLGIVEDGLADVQPRRRDRDIQAWKRFHRLCRKRCDIGAVCSVATCRYRRSALCTDRSGRGFRALAAAIGTHHAGPEGPQCLRRRLADAGGHSEHDSRLTSEIEKLAIVGQAPLQKRVQPEACTARA
jgi:hypothetical protein